MDKFYETGENAEYLELYKWEDGITFKGEVKQTLHNPKKAKRIGWIKKEYLLLWTKSIMNKTIGFSEKGLLGFGELYMQCSYHSSGYWEGNFEFD